MCGASGHRLTVEASVARAAQALEQLEKQPFDLILTDITMPNIDGLELLRTVRTRWPSTDVIILTATMILPLRVQQSKRARLIMCSKTK